MSRRISPAIVALVLLITPLLLGFAPPRQSDSPITLQLEAGFGRRYRPDTWTPLLITVANDGPDISGVLRVRADTNAGLDGTSYSTPIDLPQQSRKQVFLYVAFQSFARQVQVELVDGGDGVIASASSQLSLAQPQDVLAAVVTDSPGGSVDLTAAVLGTGQTYQHNWTLEDIPAQPEALMALDVLVFTDVDTGRLSLAQAQAVTDWVLAGGHLIVTGGPNYRLTSAGLADLLPLSVSGSITVDNLAPLATFAGQTAALAEPDIVLASGVLRPGAEALVSIGEAPLLVRQQRGGGLVDYLAADPALAPFRQWAGRSGLWDALIFVPHQQPSWAEGIQDWMMAQRVIQQAPGFALPSALEMLGMLIVYILVIGPVNYFALRLIGRRELAWFTIPVIVIVFSVLAYLTGFSLRGTQATLNRMAVVQVWPGEDRARVDGLVGVLSPRRTTYTLATADGLTLRPLPEDAGGAGGFAPVLATVAITQGSGFAAENVLVDSSVVAGFASSGFVDGAPRLEGAARIVPDSSGTHVSGQVTNTTGFELEDAAVLINGGVQHLGTLAPGASAVFDLRLMVQYSAPLSLITGDDTSLVYDNIELTAQDVLGRHYTPMRYYAPTADTEARVRRQRQNLVSALAFDRDVSGGRGDRVFLFGWAKTSPLGMTLDGAPWAPDDMTLYIFELPVTHETPSVPLTIMPGLATWAASPAGGVRAATPYDLTLNGAETAGFRFMPLPGAQLGTVARLDIIARRTSPNTATVLLKNWQTGEWEPLALESGVRGTIEDPAPYLGPNQAVELLLIPDDVNYFVHYAEIGVRWHGTF